MTENIEMKDIPETASEVETPAPTPTVFEASVVQTEEQYVAFGETVSLRRHQGLVRLICAIIFLVLAAIECGLGVISGGVLSLILGGVWLWSYVRLPRTIGRASWKQRNAMLDIAPTNYRFDEQYMYSNHPLTASTDSYRLLTDIVETEDTFQLFTGSNMAHILPKSAITGGTIDEFRTVLTARSARPVAFISLRKQRRKRLLIAILAVVLAVVVCFGGYAAGYLTHEMPLASSDTVATITLPRYLGSQFASNEYFMTYGRGVSVTATYYSFDEFDEFFEITDPTWEAYRDYLVSEELVSKDAAWTTLANGVYYAAFDYEDLYVVGCTGYAVYWTDDGCFEWVFDGEGTLEEYGALFDTWAKSITIEAAE